ncbi:terminase [Aeromonas enteropelogenes]|uniref:terminase n=1 Tax=Aeromonas enteropelogenes TaxID=29489 RepID=UPI003BA3231E
MAKHDWDKLQQAFSEEHGRTGISVKAWCEKVGLNPNSARRYLKTQGQSPAQPKKSRVAAQTAQSSAQKTAQFKPKLRSSRSAQTAQCANSEVSEAQSQQGIEEEEASQTAQPQNCADPETKRNMVSGRDCAGRFIDGHSVSAGNAGNPEPSPDTRIKPGMQLAKTHGGYAKYLDDDEAVADAKQMKLRDELILARTRAISVTKRLPQMRDDLERCDDVEQRIRLYEGIIAAEQALDRNIARIESIERSLSAIRIDDVREPHIAEDQLRVRAAARKLTAEADRLEKDGGSEATPTSEMVSELQSMGTGGLMS